MKLLTKEIQKQLPKLYETEGVPLKEKVAVVKFFTPWTNWTWYGVEYNPETRTFFGLVYGQEKEWGYFNLDELESVKGPHGLKKERDLYFNPTKIENL